MITALWLLISAVPDRQFFLSVDVDDRFSVYGIEPAHPWTDLAPGESQVADELLRRAARWRIQNRKGAHPKETPFFFEKLESAKQTATDQKSSVVVMSKSDLRILATEEVAFRSKPDQRLPSEIDFSFRFNGSDAPMAELLSLQTTPSSDMDYLTLLSAVFDHFGVTSQRIETSNRGWVVPASFGITCYSDREAYYARLGFHKTQNQPDSRNFPNVISMELTYEEFNIVFIPKLLRRNRAKPFLKSLFKAPSFQMVSIPTLAQRMNFQSQPDRCQRPLGLIARELHQRLPRARIDVRAIVRPVASPTTDWLTPHPSSVHSGHESRPSHVRQSLL